MDELIKEMKKMDSVKIPEGWFRNEFDAIEKLTGNISVFVTNRLFDGYILQLCERGNVGIVDLEYRSHDIQELFNKGEEWFEEYEVGDVAVIHKSIYSPYNSNGMWEVKN